MVVDTSALIAIVAEEPGWQVFSQAIQGLEAPVSLSAASYLEAGIVITRRGHPEHSLSRFERLLTSSGIRIVPVDEQQAHIAAEAYATYGKGRHPAALNFADCFSYALAKYLKQPLLYKGHDFAQTDVQAALLT